MRLEDLTPEAIVPLKERFLWMMFMGVMFLMLYGASNYYAALSAPHPSWYASWERKIPFVPWFIIPYMSSDLLFGVAFLLPQNRLQLRTLALRTLFIVLFSVVIFILLPLQYAFDRPLIGQYYHLFSVLYTADLPYNQLPSLHISFAIILWVSMREHIKNALLKYALAFWFWLIAFSTLLIHQHHFIDLPTGALIGLCAIFTLTQSKVASLHHFFSTPRNLFWAFSYLLGSFIALVGAFMIPTSLFTWLLVWLFIALLLISIAFTFGFSFILVGKNAQALWWQKVLFLPYFLTMYLGWSLYQKKLTLISHVEDKVYFGRHPKKSEYVRLNQHGIAWMINLALEQQYHHSYAQQTRFAFFDCTIISPKALHEVVLHIKKYQDQGVFVHCTLGLSRSAMAIGAWLIYKGYSISNVHERLSQIRPYYRASLDIQMSLELYKRYLITINDNDTKNYNTRNIV